MTTIELNNRKYSLISEIMNIDSETIINKIEKIIKKESHSKSPLSFTVEELKLEIIEAEKETISYSHDEVKSMKWKQ